MLEPLEQLGTVSQPGLERITRFMNALGNPQKQLRIVLITGTNGKGSTTAYLSRILQEEGYKVGSFYSPHLVSPCERMQINGNWISEKELLDYEQDMVRRSKAFPITYWEGLAAIAYKYFSDQQVDFAVVEILMGGRFDATNVANPLISIITKVELDHTDMLGRNVDEIAWEKAGIMKGNKAITGADDGLPVIRKEAEKVKSQLRVLGKDFFAEKVAVTAEGNEFDFLGYEFYKSLETKLLGDFQINNASLAVAAAEEIGVTPEAIRAGLLNAKHPGRLQMLSQKPLVLADGAHNPDGIGSLVTNLHLFKYDKLAVVFAAKKTKDWQKMVSLIAPHAAVFIATEYGEDSVPAEELAKEATGFTDARVEKDCGKAFETAKAAGDAVLLCGSLYLLRAMHEKGIVRLV